MQSLIKSIEIALKNKDLPGIEAHNQLMPESRVLYNENPNKTNAGVLLLIYPDIKNIFKIVFMKRPRYNGHHSQQISFPGGKEELRDTSIEQTALRESQEEIGIDPTTINIIGELSTIYIPVSNFLVFPFIGYTYSIPDFRIDRSEVDYLIEFPILNLPELKIKQFEKTLNGIPYVIPYFDINGEVIWGATSMILNEFILLLKKKIDVN